MNQHLVWIGMLVTSFGLSTACVNGQLQDDWVKISIRDGSELVGKLDDSTKLIFDSNGQAVPVDLETVEMVTISKFRQSNIEKLKLVVNELVGQLNSPKWPERESATLELSNLDGPVGWILDNLQVDHPLEASLRIKKIKKQLSANPERIVDPRDVVIVSGQVKRGWVSLAQLTVTTEIGPFTFDQSDVTKITKSKYEVANNIALPSTLSYQQALGQGEIPLTVRLFGGSKLLGKVQRDKLNALVSLERGMLFRRANKEAPFLNEEGIEFGLSSQTLDLSSANRVWKLPSTKIKFRIRR